MTDSQQLLADYVTTGSEPAFRELVTKHLGLVYSVALRLTDGNSQLAQDIAQTVFVNLARKAPSLSPEVLLGGWLHRHACYVAANTMRGERRRQSRERQAVEMNALHQDHSEADFAPIAPLLDAAINELGEADRSAIVLRYFEQRDLRAVGLALGANEDAARKRVSRALEKLHVLLTRRGVTLSSVALGPLLTAGAVKAVPAGLAASISGAALAGAAAGAGTTFTLFKAIMFMNKLKLGIVIALAATVVAVPVAIHQRARNRAQATPTVTAKILPNGTIQLTTPDNPIGNGNTLTFRTANVVIITNGTAVSAGTLQMGDSNGVVMLPGGGRLTVVNKANQPSAVADQNQCINNLRQIDGAKQQYGLENRLTQDAKITAAQIRPYLRSGSVPTCPAGGELTLGTLGELPTCSIPGHALPQN